MPQTAVTEARAQTSGQRFADRLKVLVETVHPPTRGPYTPPEITRGLQALGQSVSRSYIGKLLNGEIKNPGLEMAGAIARLFDIDVAYFTTEADPREYIQALWEFRKFVDEQLRDPADRENLEILARAIERHLSHIDPRVRRLAERASLLDPDNFEIVAGVVELHLARQGVPPAPGGPAGG